MIFISLHNSASAQIQNFRLSDNAILFYVRDVNFQLICSFRAKNILVFRMCVVLNTIFSEIARVWMLHLYSENPSYSCYFGLEVCEIIRLNLNHIYLKWQCWFSSF